MRTTTILLLSSLTLLTACQGNLGASLIDENAPLAPNQVRLYYYAGHDTESTSDGPMVGLQSPAGAFTVCSTRFVPTVVEIPGNKFPAEEAIEALLSRREHSYTPSDMPNDVNSLHNAVTNFDLTLESLVLEDEYIAVSLTGTHEGMEHDDGHAEVNCDNALLARQIELTVKNIVPTDHVSITLNGETIRADIQ